MPIKKKVTKPVKKVKVVEEPVEEVAIAPAPKVEKQELPHHHQPKMVVKDNQLVRDTSKGVVIDYRP